MRTARQAGTGSSLPFRESAPTSSNAIALAAVRIRRLAHQHGARLGGRLQTRGGVHQVARDHPLRGVADGGRRLAREHAGASLQVETDLAPERLDRVDQLERRADGALGVVLVRHRRAPDRHHGVADELLHDAAVTLDRRREPRRSTG